MPWKARDARRFTKKASTRAAKAAWAEVANSVLAKTGDEARAVRTANKVVMAHRRARRRHGA
jgi:hypothetical protein